MPANIKKREDVLKTMAAEYLRTMEEKIRQYPYQWFNYYDFWAEPKQ
jgi:predicted LPLAT superfamily acyltransferase